MVQRVFGTAKTTGRLVPAVARNSRWHVAVLMGENTKVSVGITHRIQDPAGPWQGILLGVGNVMCDATIWRRWMCRTLTEAGFEADFPGFFRPWELEYLPDVHAGKRKIQAALAAFLCSQGISQPFITELTAAAMYRLRRAEEQDCAFPGTRETLGKLSAYGFKLVVAANTRLTTQELQTKLQRLALSACVANIFSTASLGEALPSPALFRLALEKTGLCARTTVYFGGDPLALRAASRLGMTTVAYRHLDQLPADLHVSRFADLLTLVRPLSQCKPLRVKQTA